MHAAFAWKRRDGGISAAQLRVVGDAFDDPLVCKCGARMQIISFITEPRVVDRILRHRESERCKAKDPFEPRAPLSAHTRSRQ
jgi:hypothetical protein